MNWIVGTEELWILFVWYCICDLIKHMWYSMLCAVCVCVLKYIQIFLSSNLKLYITVDFIWLCVFLYDNVFFVIFVSYNICDIKRVVSYVISISRFFLRVSSFNYFVSLNLIFFYFRFTLTMGISFVILYCTARQC